ncbi:MAG TPA: ABC transporter ATP-binding protein [Candidatus Enterenecus stercoripullorum]|nr:ABC transporter ATP-binding protein [Candidatus Enterenecus stercoripullorum]
MSEERIIVVDHLTKRFGGLKAVDDVSIHLNRGETLGLIGANGAGKTTLFNMISGVLKPTSGTITFDGVEIQKKKAHEICKMGIGRTYQIVQPFTTLTLLENVLAGALMRHPRVADAREVAEGIIDMLGISHLKNTKGASLTLIQLKRMEIARALATEPKVLLLDEVMAGLNPGERVELLETMQKIKETGISIIIIEHIMKVIMTLADRAYVLNQGCLIAEDTPQKVMEHPDVIKSYIGERHYAS